MKRRFIFLKKEIVLYKTFLLNPYIVIFHFILSFKIFYLILLYIYIYEDFTAFTLMFIIMLSLRMEITECMNT